VAGTKKISKAHQHQHGLQQREGEFLSLATPAEPPARNATEKNHIVVLARRNIGTVLTPFHPRSEVCKQDIYEQLSWLSLGSWMKYQKVRVHSNACSRTMGAAKAPNYSQKRIAMGIICTRNGIGAEFTKRLPVS
jgi:hypothetical protein